MKKAGRPTLGKTHKVRTTLTLDPGLMDAVKRLLGPQANMSAFLEEAGWREVKRLSKSRPGDIRPTKGNGK